MPSTTARRGPAALLLLIALAAGSAAVPAGDASGHYRSGPASDDGTGKYYMGREISEVMGHTGAVWLEREDRVDEERTDLVVDGMKLRPTDVVADIGAGSGYFSFRIARSVPDGRVLAVDIQPEMLEIVQSRIDAWQIDNVEPRLGTIDDPRLPAESIDVAFMVDAYHEFSHPREMMEGIVRALRPGGRVVLLEYRAEDPDVPIKPRHKMTEKQVRREMVAVGLEFVTNDDFLPRQHFLIFRKPDLARPGPAS